MKIRILKLILVLLSFTSCQNAIKEKNENIEEVNQNDETDNSQIQLISASDFQIENYFGNDSFGELVYLKGTLVFENNTNVKIRDFRLSIEKSIIMKDGKVSNGNGLFLYDKVKQRPGLFSKNENILKDSVWNPSEKLTLVITSTLYQTHAPNKEFRNKDISDYFTRTPKEFKIKYIYNAVSVDEEYNYESENIDVLDLWKNYQKKIGLR